MSTSQSTTYSEDNIEYDSTRAVDGNPNGDFFGQKSCTHTKGDSAGSWSLQFSEPQLVTRYVLYNRSTLTCLYWLAILDKCISFLFI